MDRKSLIERVQKLRALSTSSNLNEAATAAQIAEKLIQEHCLQEAELEAKDGNQEFPIDDEVAFTDWQVRRTVWQSNLLSYLSNAYNCQGILKWKSGRIGYYAVGRPSDLATMRYQYAFFTVELTRLASMLAPSGLNRGEGKNWHKSFYMGAVSAIAESLAKAKSEVRAQASSTALAIVDKHKEETKLAFRKFYPETRNMPTAKSYIDREAYEIGRQAGSGLQSKPGLASGAKFLLK